MEREELASKIYNNYDIQLSYYNSIDFIFQYIKEAFFPYVFKNGSKKFKKIVSATEDKRFALDKSEESKSKYNSIFPQVNINIEQDFSLNGTALRMVNIPLREGFYNRLDTGSSILFQTDPLILAVGANVYKYAMGIEIKDETYLKTSTYAYEIYNTVFPDKMFYLDYKYLKFRLEDNLINILKAVYIDYNDLFIETSFENFLKAKFFDELSYEEDLATGNKTYFLYFKLRPLIKVSNIQINNNEETQRSHSLVFTVEMEIFLPNVIYIYSYDKINKFEKIVFEFNPSNEIIPEKKINSNTDENNNPIIPDITSPYKNEYKDKTTGLILEKSPTTFESSNEKDYYEKIFSVNQIIDNFIPLTDEKRTEIDYNNPDYIPITKVLKVNSDIFTTTIQEKYDSIKNANIKNKEDRLNNIEDNFNIVVLAGGKVIEDFKWEYNLEEKIIEIGITDLNQLPSPVVSIALYKLTKRCEKGILA